MKNFADTRVIPVLTMNASGLVKTRSFSNPTYIGDPINTVKIFNEKEVDELVLLDITATVENRPPNFDILSDIASEAFMPMAYGGGIRSEEDGGKILSLGYEKIIINSASFSSNELMANLIRSFGSSSVVLSIDVRRSFFGNYGIFSRSGKTKQPHNLIQYCKEMELLGVGEFLINSIDKDGTFSGYDLTLIKTIADVVNIPVVAVGGASCLDDFLAAVKFAGASAVAAGSFFVFHGKHRAVLVSYPSREEINKLLP